MKLHINVQTAKEVIALARKIAILSVILLGVGGLVWFFVIPPSHDTESSATAHPPTTTEQASGEDLTAATAEQLVARLTDSDPVVYKSAWIRASVPPIAPSGTEIVIDADTLQSYEAYGRVNATVKIPNKVSMRVVIHFGFAAERWLVDFMEEVK